MRIPRDQLLIGVGVNSGGVGQARIDTATVARAVIAHFSGKVEIAAVPRLEANVARYVMGDSAAVVIAAVACVQRTSRGILLQDDVDHASNRVRPILRGRAFAQHLNTGDRGAGDEIQVGAGTTLEVTGLDCQVSRGVPALAVDEDEHVVWARATELGLQSSVRRIKAEGLGGQRRHDCRERLDEVRLAGGSSQYLGAQYLNGRCTVCRLEPGLTRAGYDDFFEPFR